MEMKLGIKAKDEGGYQEKDKKKEKTKKKKNHKDNLENSSHLKLRIPRKPGKSPRQQDMRETDYFEKLKDQIIEAFENINQTLWHKEERKAIKEEFRDIVKLSDNSTLFDEHHQAVVDECDSRGKLIQESAKVVEETSQVDKKIYQVEDEKNSTQEYIDKIEEYNQNADKFTAQKESLSKFIKEESKPCKKEKARLAETTDRLTFIYYDTRITVRKNNLIEEAVDAITKNLNFLSADVFHRLLNRVSMNQCSSTQSIWISIQQMKVSDMKVELQELLQTMQEMNSIKTVMSICKTMTS